VLAFVAFAFAAISLIHVVKITSAQWKALQWKRGDPVGFARARAQYEAARQEIEQGDMYDHTEADPDDGIDGVTVGQFFSFVKYNDHYSDFLTGLPKREEAIAELFLFRAWTTQFGFRIFSANTEWSEKIISEVVNQSKYLGQALLFEVDRTDVQEDLSGSFMSLLEERWQAYDAKFLEYKEQYPPIPTRMICAQVTEYCGIDDPDKFVWLCEDFIRQLDAIKKEALRSGLLA